MSDVIFRDARRGDEAALIDLIDLVYREYGDRICLSGADKDLTDIRANYFDRGGALMVLEADVNGHREIVGAIGALPQSDRKGAATLHRFYLRPDFRNRGYARRLLEWASAWLRDRGIERVEFWSDVRFETAHKIFKKLGFEQCGIREMCDGSMPYREYGFCRELREEAANR